MPAVNRIMPALRRFKIKVKLSIIVSWFAAIFCLVLVVYLNFLLVRYLFEGEFAQNIASIEISYIQMAKFWVEGGGLWQPLWYLGYPWHVFYTPLLPALEVLLYKTVGFSFAHAYRVIVGASYILVPATLYLFVWQIGRSKTGALIAAFFYSFIPSVIGLFFAGVRGDTISGIGEPRRFTILVRWGEGPHTVALVFLPLFGLFLSRYLAERKFIDLILTSLFLGLVTLTNAIALWAAFLLLVAFFLSQIAKKDNVIALTRDFLLIGTYTFGLIAFWYNLPFVKTFFREGSGALGNWLALFPWSFIPLLAVFVAVVLVVNKFGGKFRGMPLAVFWFLMLFSLVFAYYVSGDDQTEYVPQVLRLNTEVDMALSVVIGVLISNLFLAHQKLAGKLKIGAMVLAHAVVVVAAGSILLYGTRLFAALPEHTKPFSATRAGDIKNTSEYRVAERLAAMTKGTDQRVFAPANYGFWLNFFEPVPQLRGALFQSSTHFWPDHIYYQVANGGDANITLAWLKIANVGKLVYTTAASAETYKDYRVPPEKFSSVLKQTFSENGDIYFDVPLANDSLAKVVDYKPLLSVKKPKNAIDEQPIFAYARELEKKAERKVRVEKITNGRWRLSGELTEGEAVLFQQTYDSGWKIKGGGWRILKDPLDFTLLVPKKTGQFEIDLIYAKPLSVYLGYLITLITLVVIIKRARRIAKSG